MGAEGLLAELSCGVQTGRSWRGRESLWTPTTDALLGPTAGVLPNLRQKGELRVHCLHSNLPNISFLFFFFFIVGYFILFFLILLVNFT